MHTVSLGQLFLRDGVVFWRGQIDLGLGLKFARHLEDYVKGVSVERFLVGTGT